ncbi:1938_t:CDS:2, partial [Dentiscutata erythropus]
MIAQTSTNINNANEVERSEHVSAILRGSKNTQNIKDDSTLPLSKMRLFSVLLRLNQWQLNMVFAKIWLRYSVLV